MKRLFGGLAVSLLAFAFVPSLANATHSNGQGPNQDTLHGTARLPIETFVGTHPSQQHISASSDARGNKNTIGHFFIRIDLGPPFQPGTEEEFSGDVLCLTVDGNHSIDRGVVTESSGPIGPLTGLGFFGEHIDNGEPGKGGKDNPPDEASGALTPAPGPNPICPPPAPFGRGQPVEQGNFVVHDGI